MKLTQFSVRILPFLFVLVHFLSACSGGGGGDGDGGGSSQRGRTQNTAVRIVHASIDAPPVEISLTGQVLQKVRFAEATSYAPTNVTGPVVLELRIPNTAQILKTFNTTLDDKTEYTVFLTGESRTEDLRAELIRDVVARPDAGEAQLRVFHGMLGTRSIIPNVNGVNLGTVAPGEASDFLTTASGPVTLTIDTTSGERLYQGTVELPDRGELSVLITGSRELGLKFVTLYSDLD